MFTKRLMAFPLLLIFMVSLWSCKNPHGPDYEDIELEGFGTLWIYSTPWHADIWIDGHNTGLRTHNYIDVSAGTHTILILKPGYQDWETTVTVANGEDVEIDARLVSVNIIVTNPTAAATWIKGQEVTITWEVMNPSTSSVSTGNVFNRSNSSRNVFSPFFHEIKLSSKSFKIDRDSKNFSSEDVENINQKERNLRNMNKNFYRGRDNIPIDNRIYSQKTSSEKKRTIKYLPDVKIYLYKEDSEVLTIIDQLENEWSYTWTVDLSLVDGTDYKIRVNVWPENPNMAFIYGESDEFTITGSD